MHSDQSSSHPYIQFFLRSIWLCLVADPCIEWQDCKAIFVTKKKKKKKPKFFFESSQGPKVSLKIGLLEAFEVKSISRQLF